MPNDLTARIGIIDAAFDAGDICDVKVDPRQAFLLRAQGLGQPARDFATAMQTKAVGGESATIAHSACAQHCTHTHVRAPNWQVEEH